MAEFIRLLLIEDNEADAELVRLELERGGFKLEWQRVQTESQLRHALEEREWDLIISDYAMPQFDGIQAFQVVRSLCLDVPFIFVSGALGEDRAVEAMRAGARDYLLKGNLTRLSVAVRRELSVRDTQRSERRLKASAKQEQLRYAMAVEASGTGIFEVRPDSEFPPYLSPRLLQILGRERAAFSSLAELSSWADGLLHPEDAERARDALRGLLIGKDERCSCELRVLHADGHWIDVAAFAHAMGSKRDRSGLHVVGGIMDLSGRKLLEAQLRQAQKMEAVGRLAGGVAHDFNNLLTAIFTFCRFAMDGVETDSPAYNDMAEVLKAGRRAEALTRQLLAFSRRQAVLPRVIDVNEHIRELERMLRRVVGEDVNVQTDLDADLWKIKVDPGSLEQVIMNLAVNARDAMPRGGALTIATRNEFVETPEPRGDDVVPVGAYVAITVTDTGTGMDEETKRRVFEPFFTTKPVGEGTGLGLATCYGIVSQAGGYIWVADTTGQGTTFEIRLPTTSETMTTERSQPISRRSGGAETILVVEDEEQLRRLTARALRSLGYSVVEAANGAEALALARDGGNSIDLLLTDVVMPVMGGKQLADTLTQQFPNIRVLFMSGYTADAIAHHGVLLPGTHLLDKPFTPETLGHAVRTVLDHEALA